ncbi:MAG: beta-galactosidase, partial [Planctomycetota bacterium]
MGSVTFDGRTFSLDGRRIWLVGGEIDHATVPPGEWADRVHAAKLAGVNTIATRVVWSMCEPRPGTFGFEGRTDVRGFVETVKAAGLMCVLRPGPFVGGSWDLGGIPTWLAQNEDVGLRSSSQGFLEACSRYISALAEQVKDLQATSTDGGPIVLIEHEHDWTCGEATIAGPYLRELARYFRESGLTAPAVNSNNLWHSEEGQIDGWVGETGLFSITRQLAAVRPDQPRLVVDLPVPRPPRLRGSETPAPLEPLALLRAAVETAAAGGQFSLSAFVGSTPGAFWSGRDTQGIFAAGDDASALVDSSGSPTPHYGPLRRVSRFLSTFGRSVLAPATEAATIVPDPASAAESGAVSVVSTSGPQGGVAWVFAGKQKGTTPVVPLVMPNGSSISVPIGEQGVAWCLL